MKSVVHVIFKLEIMILITTCRPENCYTDHDSHGGNNSTDIYICMEMVPLIKPLEVGTFY